MTNTNPISIDETNTPKASAPRVVIVGGGFGGLAAAKAQSYVIFRQSRSQQAHDYFK